MFQTTIQSGFARSRSEALYPRLFPDAGWWCPSLQSPGGTRLHDLRGGNWGTLTNMDPATDWVVNGGRYALDFDGTNDFVNLGNPPVVRSGSPLFVCAWFRTSTNAFQSIVAKSLLGGATHRWWLSTNTGSVEANGTSGTSGNTASFATTYTDGNWHHIGGLYSGSVLTLFYDGRPRATTAITQMEPSAYTLLFGKYNDGSGGATGSSFQFAGQIDDVRAYNTAMTAADIRQLWQLGRGNMPLVRKRRYTEEAAATTNRRRRLIFGSNC